MSGGVAVDPAVVAEGYARCAEVTREHGTTYYWGARLLPERDRRHVFAVYTLARLADDIVDGAGPDPGPETAAGLDAFEARFHEALDTGGADDPVLAAVAWTVHERGIPGECFDRFFRAMRSDLTRRSYETWQDLLGYMDGSAAVIGEMMLPVLHPMTDVVAPARALGLAFQLTNFLRDVGEDLDRGRVYLPQEDLRRFGADPHARVVTPQWRELMAFEVARNRRLYREADAGLAGLPPASRRCVATARVLYARILDRIEAADYDVFATRARVPTPAKAALAARMVLARDPVRLVARDRASATRDLGWVSDDPVVLVDAEGSPAGTAPKSAIHHDDTPLHLAFSCYVVDDAGRLLVTTRAASKPSFPGVVTNTVCGHPLPGEDLDAAVRRRARDELGVEVTDVRLVLPRFRYRAAMGGVVENEVCPVLVARAAAPAGVRPDPEEVDATAWVPWGRFASEVLEGRRTVSPWCAEQVPLLVRLGPDPRDWPAAPRADLPPAARLGAAVEAV